MDGVSKEWSRALEAMAKTKNLDEKETYRRIVKNRCESLGVFLNLVSDMVPFECDDHSAEEDLPF